VSGSGVSELSRGDVATFWVYSADDAESTIRVDATGGPAQLAVNGREVMGVSRTSSTGAVWLSGGINKITVTGQSRTLLDRIRVPGR
jgi:hypothetical protein